MEELKITITKHSKRLYCCDINDKEFHIGVSIKTILDEIEREMKRLK